MCSATASRAAARPSASCCRAISRRVADEPPKKEVAKPAADLTGRGAILLVEDEEAVRAFASRALASRGYTVLEADSGADALRVVENAGGEIDLIVSDVIMPEMDGPTMLTELRRRGLTAKIIFVSGYADDAFAKQPARGRGISVPAQAVHAQAIDRDGEGRDELSRFAAAAAAAICRSPHQLSLIPALRKAAASRREE